MTATPTTRSVRRLRAADVPEVSRALTDARSPLTPAGGWVANQMLLDALDRGEHARFVAWPASFGGAPAGLVYIGSGGTVVPAGLPEAGPPLAEALDRIGWRVLIGDAPLAQALVEVAARGLFRRTPRAREQRFMVAAEDSRADPRVPVRGANPDDVPTLTEFACALHVEDQMGPPISRSGREAVQERMRDSVLRGLTWVAHHQGRPIAKVDLSLRSRQRGAQIAGVYVDPAWRGRGVGTAIVAAVVAQLRAAGAPAVSLHVRSDNGPAIAAYRRAGFIDRGPWLLALR